MNQSAKMTGGASLYNQVGVQTGVGAASPHKLIQMLLDAALEKIASAKGFMTRGEIQARGLQISHAISIVDGLRASLDMEKGGELSTNLYNLYDYIERRLFDANLEVDAKILDEVAGLLGQVKSAWDAIPESTSPMVNPQTTTAQATDNAR